SSVMTRCRSGIGRRINSVSPRNVSFRKNPHWATRSTVSWVRHSARVPLHNEPIPLRRDEYLDQGSVAVHDAWLGLRFTHRMAVEDKRGGGQQCYQYQNAKDETQWRVRVAIDYWCGSLEVSHDVIPYIFHFLRISSSTCASWSAVMGGCHCPVFCCGARSGSVRWNATSAARCLSSLMPGSSMSTVGHGGSALRTAGSFSVGVVKSARSTAKNGTVGASMVSALWHPPWSEADTPVIGFP